MRIFKIFDKASEICRFLGKLKSLWTDQRKARVPPARTRWWSRCRCSAAIWTRWRRTCGAGSKTHGTRCCGSWCACRWRRPATTSRCRTCRCPSSDEGSCSNCQNLRTIIKTKKNCELQNTIILNALIKLIVHKLFFTVCKYGMKMCDTNCFPTWKHIVDKTTCRSDVNFPEAVFMIWLIVIFVLCTRKSCVVCTERKTFITDQWATSSWAKWWWRPPQPTLGLAPGELWLPKSRCQTT